MFPKMIRDDELTQSLFEVLTSVLLIVGLFCVPSFAALFEGEHPGWQVNEVGRIRRHAWPLLKDPDSLLCIQTMLRCLILATVLKANRSDTTNVRRGTVQGRALTNAALLLLVAAYGTKVVLFQFSLFRLEGPIGGFAALALDALAVVLVALVSAASVAGSRFIEVITALMLTPLVLSISGWAASHNYLVVDPQAGSGGNAAFTFMNLTEALGSILLLAGLLAGAGWRPGMLLMLLGVFQQVIGFYYMMDSLEKAPQSTLSFNSQLDVEVVSLPMQGSPEELLLVSQSAELAAVLLGALVLAFCPAGLRAAAPGVAPRSAPPVADAEEGGKQAYKLSTDMKCPFVSVDLHKAFEA